MPSLHPRPVAGVCPRTEASPPYGAPGTKKLSTTRAPYDDDDDDEDKDPSAMTIIPMTGKHNYNYGGENLGDEHLKLHVPRQSVLVTSPGRRTRYPTGAPAETVYRARKGWLCFVRRRAARGESHSEDVLSGRQSNGGRCVFLPCPTRGQRGP